MSFKELSKPSKNYGRGFFSSPSVMQGSPHANTYSVESGFRTLTKEISDVNKYAEETMNFAQAMYDECVKLSDRVVELETKLGITPNDG